MKKDFVDRNSLHLGWDLMPLSLDARMAVGGFHKTNLFWNQLKKQALLVGAETQDGDYSFSKRAITLVEEGRKQGRFTHFGVTFINLRKKKIKEMNYFELVLNLQDAECKRVMFREDDQEIWHPVYFVDLNGLSSVHNNANGQTDDDVSWFGQVPPTPRNTDLHDC